MVKQLLRKYYYIAFFFEYKLFTQIHLNIHYNFKIDLIEFPHNLTKPSYVPQRTLTKNSANMNY